MHLSPEFGLTVRFIENDGIEIAERIEMLLSSDTPQAIAKSMGLGQIGFGQAFSRYRPDILVVYGDRYEMLAAVLAALPFKIPVAHLSGGELTEGAIDDALRHSITKLSHLHFAATQEYARRIIQLGEEPWRVTVSGESSLDNLRTMKMLSRSELEARCQLQLDGPFLLVTYHPTTLEFEQAEWQIDELLTALAETKLSLIFALPNADTGNRVIREKLERFVASNHSTMLVDNFGPQAYFSMMNLATAMVGNSSSGIVESTSFRLPVVNIGARQHGRIRACNVIDVGYCRAEISKGIQRAIDPEFRTSLSGLMNPYGNGEATPIILERLKSAALGESLIKKKFYDVPFNQV
jgi:UDP-hydrolysing UDP-N-acetyl-D-glucosamine 2-epimerase